MPDLLTGIDRVVVAVRDLESATRSYERMLGREPSWRGFLPVHGVEQSVFQLANGALELRSPRTSSASGAREPVLDRQQGAGSAQDLDAALADRAGCVFAVVFACDDAERASKWLAERRLCDAPPHAVEWRSLRVPGNGGPELRRTLEVSLDRARTRGVCLQVAELETGTLEPANALEDPPATLAGFDHIVIRTADADACCELYRDALDIRLALDRRFDERGVRLLFFRLGGVTVELAARIPGPTGADSPNSMPDQERPDVFGGIAYAVANPYAVRQRVHSAGFDVSEVRPGNKPGTAVCTVRGGTCGVPTLLIGPA